MIQRSLPALALLTTLGCNTPQGRPLHEMASEINATLAEVSEVVVPGDVLQIQVANLGSTEAPDLSQELIVPFDGRINLPGVGAVRAAGRTPSQLTELVSDAYTSILGGAEPLLAVSIRQQAPRSLHVIGAVDEPGEYPIEPDGRVTLVEALARAGGVRWLVSYMGSTVLIRWDPETQSQKSWVIDARAKWWAEPDTVFLQPNDVLYVPTTNVVRVNTWIDRYIVRMIPFPRFIVPAGY